MIFRRSGSRRWLPAPLLIVVALVAVGCLPVNAPPEPPESPPPPSALVSTSPALFPAFTTDVSDYVSRCNASTPVQVAVDAPPGTTVSVDGQPAQGGSYTTQVTRDYSQSFTIVVQTSAATTTHYVRCLPPDFPNWTAQRNGQTQAEFYLTSPTGYPIIFDNNGVPMWWYLPSPGQSLSMVLPNPTNAGETDVAFPVAEGPPGLGGVPANAAFEERKLDGTLVASVDTVGASSDGHDLIRRPDNGNYVMVTTEVREHVDIRAAWGDPNASNDATIINHVIQEVTPQGALVWSWDTFEHIPPQETDPQWRAFLIATANTAGLYDIYHWNSIEWTGSGFLLSYRHLDAVYNISRDTGDVVWKLGGSARDESLTLSDPFFANFGGQHDARLLDDGSVTLHDNGSFRGRWPRAIRYTIDTEAGTATLAEMVVDPLAQSSFCCGSARRLPGGNWVMGWGGTSTTGVRGTQVTTEMNPFGERFFLLELPDQPPLYRTVPVLPGQLSRQALRDGMDARYASQSVEEQTTAPPTPDGKIGPEFSELPAG